MSTRMKALKNSRTGQIIYFFPDQRKPFPVIDHEVVTVEVTEILSPLCSNCKYYDSCKSALRGKDFDCSSYELEEIS